MTSDVAVLVVDDQAPFRRAAEAVLRRTPGFRLVGEARDGAEAVRRVAELQPSLVLMDVRMPVMGGVEATRAIAASWPSVVVVLCSTYDLVDLPEQAAASGAAASLHKEELRPSLLAELWHAAATRRAAPAPG